MTKKQIVFVERKPLSELIDQLNAMADGTESTIDKRVIFTDDDNWTFDVPAGSTIRKISNGTFEIDHHTKVDQPITVSYSILRISDSESPEPAKQDYMPSRLEWGGAALAMTDAEWKANWLSRFEGKN